MIEMEVRDRDRVDLRPAVLLAHTGQDSRPAVEQQASRPLDEVTGLRAPWVRPGGRASDDFELHECLLPRRAAAITFIYLRIVAGRIRVVIAKPGLDGHDRGAKIIARALRDAGMEVIYTGLHQTPEQIVETAIQEDADAVGISILSGAHMTLVPRILEGLRENEADDVLVVVGGTIPADDAAELKRLGVGEVFTPGTPTGEIVDFLQKRVGAPA